MNVRTIYHRAERNPVEGTEGTDNLRGTAKPNLIQGHGGNDNINGQGGDDFIIGGAGNDTMRGGDGNDVFSYSSFLSSGERDRVTDFKHGVDVLDLSGLGITANDVNIVSQGRGGQIHEITFDGHPGEITLIGKGFDLSDVFFG